MTVQTDRKGRSALSFAEEALDYARDEVDDPALEKEKQNIVAYLETLNGAAVD